MVDNVDLGNKQIHVWKTLYIMNTVKKKVVYLLCSLFYS